MQDLIGWGGPRLEFDVAVHFGTFLAILLAFKDELKGILRDPLGRKTRLIVVGTVPAAVAGLLVHWRAREIFESAPLAAFMLLLTGGYLWSSRRKAAGLKLPWNTSYLDALLVGIAQAMALLPGLSRSGLTITTCLHLGLSRPWAGEFSFLLALPALLGATVLELPKAPRVGIPFLTVGAASAFLSGYLALRFLLGVIRRGKIHLFAPYCWIAGSSYLLYWLWR